MVRKHFYIEEKDLDFLDTLPETSSEHIRRAIYEYIQKIKNQNVSESLSKKGGENG